MKPTPAQERFLRSLLGGDENVSFMDRTCRACERKQWVILIPTGRRLQNRYLKQVTITGLGRKAIGSE